MIWTTLPNWGKGKNLCINYLMLAKCSNEYISLNGQFCELSCASFKLTQYLLTKVSARDDEQELARICRFVISILNRADKSWLVRERLTRLSKCHARVGQHETRLFFYPILKSQMGKWMVEQQLEPFPCLTTRFYATSIVGLCSLCIQMAYVCFTNWDWEITIALFKSWPPTFLTHDCI